MPCDLPSSAVACRSEAEIPFSGLRRMDRDELDLSASSRYAVSAGVQKALLVFHIIPESCKHYLNKYININQTDTQSTSILSVLVCSTKVDSAPSLV